MRTSLPKGCIIIVEDDGLRVISHSITQFHKGIREGMLAEAPEMVKMAQKGILDPPKTGRLYMIGGQIHQASAPGEFPAELTGTLRMGIRYSVKGHDELVIGDTIDYGKDLEEGRPGMAPRPHLRPSALGRAREFEQALHRGVLNNLKP